MKHLTRYSRPEISDLGSVEEITLGQINIDIDDFPVGARDVLSGPIPGQPDVFPTLPPL